MNRSTSRNRATFNSGLPFAGPSRWADVLFFGTLVFGLFACGGHGQCVAQIKYSPEHPEVKAMADRAASQLRFSSGGLAGVGEATLSALAYVEYVKRYEGKVPRDHPGVNGTVKRVLDMFPKNNGGNANKDIFKEGENYFPALALILLAEVDATKYKAEIISLLDMFEQRQRPWGAFTYVGQDTTADTSQTQFVALALWVAKSHGFDVDIEMSKKALDWLCKAHGGSGRWVYKYSGNGFNSGGQQSTLSMHASGLSTVYLLADQLQLYQRRKQMTKGGTTEAGFPRTVTIYTPPVDGQASRRTEGPLTNFDRGLLSSTVNAGNSTIEPRFTYGIKAWNYYYMYAIERYAYFREQAEGDVGNGAFRDWYDKGVEFLKSKQSSNGGFAGLAAETNQIATAFAVLFLVRSSEIINLPPASSRMQGGNRLATDVALADSGNGQINEVTAEKNLNDLIQMLKDDENVSSEKLARINNSLKKQIVEFRQKDNKSRGEIKAFLVSMVGASNYYRRLIAVRFLAGEQDMDNVPALLYALTDPDLRIALEAHNGLRLISRKIDSLALSDETVRNAARDPDVIKQDPDLMNRMRQDFSRVEKRWTDWFMKIRPDAELLGNQSP